MNKNVVNITDYKEVAPGDMDSFNDGTNIKKNSGNSNNRNNDGGNHNMDKFATKEELKHTQELLSEKIDHRSDVIEEKIVSVKSQIESSNKILYWILGIFGTILTSLLIKLLTK
ncbi:hypothetical protein [Companilactobacillus heilongjiangensis]|uniref:Uncharacterized protein n=1 Tax=Companilactobacillus heilongjiangensis TaxID=1074467 RepID=A0A0K2LD57_9LACO|nr:hypothetical protein [Companilactobacillus heilongjiangensis]ALB29236.1 hypothetical protein JP39_07575 [Companilactobacillus heilongjiangensis]